MTGGDAMGEEMELIRSITEDEELVAFARTLRANLLQTPTGAVARTMPARLADVARGSTNGRPAESNGHRDSGRTGAARPPLGSRIRRPLLRLAVAVAAIPLLFSGLAVAGVELPDPASDAFESIGIELPNQSTDSDTAGTAQDGDSAGSETGQESSTGKLGGGQTEPSQAGAVGRTDVKQSEEQKEGGALGEPGLVPETPDAPGAEGEVGSKPVSPPAGPPESPGSSSGNIPDGAGPGAGGAGQLGPLFSPDEGPAPNPAKP